MISQKKKKKISNKANVDHMKLFLHFDQLTTAVTNTETSSEGQSVSDLTHCI